MTPSRRLLVICAAALAAAAAVAMLAIPSDPGPVRGSPFNDAVGVPADVNEAVAWGDMPIWNTGRNDVMLDRVDLDAPRGVHLVEAYVMPPGAMHSGIGSAYGRPSALLPSGAARQAAGFVLRPGTYLAAEDAAELVLGVVVDVPGRSQSGNVLVHYRVLGRSYVVSLHTSLIVCAPKDTYLRTGGCSTGT